MDKQQKLNDLVNELKDARRLLAIYSNHVRRRRRIGWIVIITCALIFLTVSLIFISNKGSNDELLQLPSNQLPEISSIGNDVSKEFEPVSREVITDTLYFDVHADTLGNLIQQNIQNEKRIVIIFNEGLFENGANPSKPARKALLALSKYLNNSYRIIVIGHTDNLPVLEGSIYGSNDILGLKRAAAAASIIIHDNPSLLSCISLRGAGENDPPFDNDSRENQRRNRSVVIYISRLNDY